MWHFRVKYIFICPCPPSSLFHHHRLYVLSLCVLLPFYLFCGSSISSFLVYRDLKRRGGRASSLLDIVCVRRVLQAGPGGRLHACSSCARAVFRRLAPEGVFLLAFLRVPHALQAGPGGHLHACSSGPGGLLRSCALAHFLRRTCTFRVSFPSFSTCACIFPTFYRYLHLHFDPPLSSSYLSYLIGVPPYLTTAKMNNTYRR